MKILFPILLLSIRALHLKPSNPTPRNLLIMTAADAKEKKYAQQKSMLAEQAKQVKVALERFGMNAGLQEFDQDAMDAIHERYIRARMQMDYVKNFLNNQMDDVYNNFIGMNKWFY